MAQSGQAHAAPRLRAFIGSLLAPVHAALTRHMSRSGMLLYAGEAPSYESIASFLVDNPSADHDGESDLSAETPDPAPRKRQAAPSEQAAEQAETPPGDDEEPEGDEGGDEPTDEPEDDESEQAEGQQGESDRKIKVTVKGDDGAEKIEEVSEKELAASYMRHADYTRKTQALAQQQAEAAQIVERKLTEGTQELFETAHKTKLAIIRLAALKSPQEMQALAVQDRGAWVEETARQAAINEELSAIDAEVAQAKQRLDADKHQEAVRQHNQAWETLNKAGIDRQKVLGIFAAVQKEFDVPSERFKTVTDPKLVMIFDAAAKYKALQRTSKTETKEVLKKTPAVPQQRAAVPRQAREEKTARAKFRSGRADVKDLGAFILRHGG